MTAAKTEAAKPAAPSTPLSVQAAISEVMRRLPSIGKSERAPAAMGGFQYRGIEAMTKVIQPIMADVGLVIIPHARVVSVGPAPGRRDVEQDVTLEVSWKVVGPDGSHFQAQTVGIGRDGTDKGANKAASQAFKYLLMHLFCVSDAEDDADGHDYTQGEPTIWEGTWTRVLASIKKYPESAAILKALAELMEHKLTLRSIQEDEDFHQAVIAQLDDLDIVAAADAAHADEPSAPAETGE